MTRYCTLFLLSSFSQKTELKIFCDFWANSIASWVLSKSSSSCKTNIFRRVSRVDLKKRVFLRSFIFWSRATNLSTRDRSFKLNDTLYESEFVQRLSKSKTIKQILTHILVLKDYFHKASFVSSRFSKSHSELWRS